MTKTVYVAVHGIGDQVKFSTAQAVARRVYAHAGKPFSRSLGHFHSDLERGDPKTGHQIGAPFYPDDLPGSGFTEVYWADVARGNVDGYTLQETRQWADMLATRIEEAGKRQIDEAAAERHDATGGEPPTEAERRQEEQRLSKLKGEINYDLIRQVLAEIRETLSVTEAVVTITKNVAQVGSEFKLKKLLDSFLGDVQFVAEYATIRDQIIERFNNALRQATRQADGTTLDPDVEVVVVSHSEGTVVALLGLLRAASRRQRDGGGTPDWLGRVKALVTLGSPIDKHLLLWPELWFDLDYAPGARSEPIRWWNYYDRGDPVGFELDMARDELTKHGFLSDDGRDALFDFREQHDIGYTRSAVPGKAHTDYWHDQAVFDHFLDALAPGETPSQPTTRPVCWSISYFVPYLLIFVLMIAAVMALGKGAEKGGWLVRPVVEEGRIVPPSVAGDRQGEGLGLLALLGLTSLLAGTTVWSRIRRLARKRAWHWIGFGVFVGLFAVYLWLVPEWHQKLFPGLHWRVPGLGYLDLGIVAGVVGYLGRKINERFPRWGLKPLVFLGAFAVIWSVHHTTISLGYEIPALGWASLWPVAVGGIAFLYIWWFSALLFDLTFVWHRYVRHSVRGKPPPGAVAAVAAPATA